MRATNPHASPLTRYVTVGMPFNIYKKLVPSTNLFRVKH